MNIHPTDAGFFDAFAAQQMTSGRLPDTQTYRVGPRFGYEVFRPNALDPVYTSPAIYSNKATAFAASRAYLKAHQGEVFK